MESKPLIIEICPVEPRATMCLANGGSVRGSEYESDIMDCVASGDVEPACAYVRDEVGVEFRTVARDESGNYENRLATAREMADTCRAIYFESESDFDDTPTAALYLIWEAADNVQNEETE